MTVLNTAPQQRAVTNKQAINLLKTIMPRMHPSALKHQYLTAVANAYLHKQATSPGADKSHLNIIGFADPQRTIPLILIAQPDKHVGFRISHAFVPNMNKQEERDLVLKLQEADNQWAAQRGAPKRNIVDYLQRNNSRRDYVLKYGLPQHPDSAFTQQDIVEAHTKWYPYVPFDTSLELKHNNLTRLADPDTREVITENVIRSVNYIIDHNASYDADRYTVMPHQATPSPRAERAMDHQMHVWHLEFDQKALGKNILHLAKIEAYQPAQIHNDTPQSDYQRV